QVAPGDGAAVLAEPIQQPAHRAPQAQQDGIGQLGDQPQQAEAQPEQPETRVQVMGAKAGTFHARTRLPKNAACYREMRADGGGGPVAPAFLCGRDPRRQMGNWPSAQRSRKNTSMPPTMVASRLRVSAAMAMAANPA